MQVQDQELRRVQLIKAQRIEGEDDGAEEILLDALIGEACGDDEALEERMTFKEVFDDVTRLLGDQKQEYSPCTISDLHLLH